MSDTPRQPTSAPDAGTPRASGADVARPVEVEREWLGWARPWRATVVLVALVAVAKLAYLLWLCPYTLVEDEAHYWEWSRRLDWSYYTKGPGIAATIWASTGIFRLLGLPEGEAAVRAAAPVASAALMLAVAWLGRAITRDGRVGFLAASLVGLAPGFHLISVLMTIDGPYAACWGVAAACGWAALARRGGWGAWVGMGLAIGAGFTYKYTILLLPPGIALFALWQRRAVAVDARWRAMLAASAGAAALGLVPVLIWNAQNDWGTVRHLLGHLGLRGGDMGAAGGGWAYDPRWTLVLLLAQLGLMGPALVVAGWEAAKWRKGEMAKWPNGQRARGPDGEEGARGEGVDARGAALAGASSSSRTPRRGVPPEAMGVRYLVACAAPIFVFYLGVSLVAEPEGNWPLAGHVTMFPLAAMGVVRAVARVRALRDAWWARPSAPRPRRYGARALFSGQPQTAMNVVWLLALMGGVGFAAATLRLDLVSRGPFMRFVEARAAAWGWIEEGRPIIPLGRIMFADVIARDAERVRRELGERAGREAFVIGQQYGRASLLAFYMPGRPVVYCSSSRSEGRVTQYDHWRDTDLDDPALLGRPAVLVGGRLDQWEPAFERVEPVGQLEGETKRGRQTWIGLGYRGFPGAGGGAR